MSLLGTRRAAEELDRALDRALDGDAGELKAGNAPLVALGERLRLVGTELEQVAAPREDFRATLRTRLVAVAAVQPTPVAPPSGALGRRGGRGQKAAGVAAGALASIVAVSGVAVASTQALPGDPFYGVKRTVEGLQLRVADDRVDEGDRRLQFAQTRLDEVGELALGRDAELTDAPVAASPDADWDRVRETLAVMDDETRKGSALLEQAWREDGDADALRTLSEFAAQQSAKLQQLLTVMPPEARSDAEASLGLVNQVAATTSELLGLGSCTAQCASGGTSGSGGSGHCDCATPSTSPSSGSAPSGIPAPPPAGPAPAPVAPAPDPAGPPPAPTTRPPTPLPSLVPSPLPTELTTVAPSLAPRPAPLPLPSLDPELDDLAPGDAGDVLPG